MTPVVKAIGLFIGICRDFITDFASESLDKKRKS